PAVHPCFICMGYKIKNSVESHEPCPDRRSSTYLIRLAPDDAKQRLPVKQQQGDIKSQEPAGLDIFMSPVVEKYVHQEDIENDGQQQQQSCHPGIMQQHQQSRQYVARPDKFDKAALAEGIH